MGRAKKKSHSKLYLIFVIVLLILVSLFFINFLKSNQEADTTGKAVKANISAISTFNYSRVVTVEAQIKKLEDTEARGNFDVSKKLTKAQYKKIFNSSVVIGDSITEGLSAYGFLTDAQVFCKIGASVMYGEDLFASAAGTYPAFAFLSFGMNDMGNYTGHADMFITKYVKLIKQFKKISPDTLIFVNGITPPSDGALAGNKILGNYKKFNNALKEMCKTEKLTYIDNNYIIEEHPEFYAGDGIHVSTEYYPLWLNNMILKAGL